MLQTNTDVDVLCESNQRRKISGERQNRNLLFAHFSLSHKLKLSNIVFYLLKSVLQLMKTLVFLVRNQLNLTAVQFLFQSQNWPWCYLTVNGAEKDLKMFSSFT